MCAAIACSNKCRYATWARPSEHPRRSRSEIVKWHLKGKATEVRLPRLRSQRASRPDGRPVRRDTPCPPAGPPARRRPPGEAVLVRGDGASGMSYPRWTDPPDPLVAFKATLRVIWTRCAAPSPKPSVRACVKPCAIGVRLTARRCTRAVFDPFNDRIAASGDMLEALG